MVIFTAQLVSTLDSKVKKALQRGEYTIDEVREVQKEVDEHQKQKQKGFIRALIITAGVFVLMAALSIPQMGNPVVLFTMLITGGALALIMVYVKFVYVNAVQRQFVKAVKKGYPDFPFDRS